MIGFMHHIHATQSSSSPHGIYPNTKSAGVLNTGGHYKARQSSRPGFRIRIDLMRIRIQHFL
jgi:hypothetical protein